MTMYGFQGRWMEDCNFSRAYDMNDELVPKVMIVEIRMFQLPVRTKSPYFFCSRPR